MRSPAEFAETYQHMSDGQLLQTAREDGLLPEAKQALHEEINRRNLKQADLPHSTEPNKTRLEKETEERWLPLSRYRWGYGFYGRSYLDESDKESKTQLKTKFFVCAGIPLVPIASYRFKCEEDEDKPLNRLPINWPQVFRVWFTTFLWIAGTIAAIAFYEWIKGHRR